MTIPLPTSPVLLTFMLVGELVLMRSRLSGDPSRQADRGSLRIILGVIFASVGLAWLAARAFPQAKVQDAQALACMVRAGLGLFVAGLSLRWYAVAYLGRSFTYDVAVEADQPVVDSGPCRPIRHPAYTGSLLSFLGLGLCGGNLVALGVLVVPIAWAFLHRIAIEETVLTSTLGSRYGDYAARTKRLFPFVY